MVTLVASTSVPDVQITKRGMAKGSTTEEYLAQHHILTYVEDAITQLLKHKDDMPKVDINRFFAQYFSCLKDGKHTLLRNFEFINSTPYNRACFIDTFLKCFAFVGKKGDLLTIRDYYALVSIICDDFPYEILQKTAKIVLIDDAHDCLISFTDFLYSFQIQLYYQEFLEASSQLHHTLLVETHSPRDIVVPTDHTTEPHKEKSHANNTQSSDGVDSMKYFRSLSQLPDKNRFSIPSLSALKEILSSTPTVTFYGFLVALSKSEAINNSIGKLPASANIFDGIELNMSDIKAMQMKAESQNSTTNPMPPAAVDETNITKLPTPAVKGKKEVRTTPRRTGTLRAARKNRRDSSDSSSEESSDTDT